jgi:hypothetical protein
MIYSISIRWAENATCTGEIKSGYIKIVWKPVGKIRRPRRKYEDDIKMDTK